MNFYAEMNYKDIIFKSILEKKRHLNRKFTFQKLAESCGMQKTYLSKVLKHEGHLNDDQLYHICQYLGFDSDEQEYIFLLYFEAKSQVPKRKKELKNKILLIQNQKKKTENQISIKNQDITPNMLERYYLDPYYQIIHMFLTIDQYARNVELIKKNLSISEEKLNKYITDLQHMKIIKIGKSKFEVIKNNLHLSDTSPLYPAYQTLMKIKTLEQIQKKDDSYSFSVIFSCSTEIKNQIHNNFLNFLKQSQNLVSQSSEKEVFQMNFDLFSWS